MKNPAFVGGCAGLGLALLAINALGLTGHAAGIGAVICILAGAICAKALERSLLGAISGFWHSVPGRWLIGRIAGAAVILLLAGPVHYGVWLAFYWIIYGLYAAAVPELIVLVARFYQLFSWLIVASIVWRLRTLVKIAVGKGSRPMRRWYRSFHMGRGGSAGFASIVEEWANRWQPGMIFLGHSLHDRRWPVGIRDDRMQLTLAGTGGGKGQTAIIPNLLTYSKGSVFCMDVKGQNAAVTAQARRDMGQDVYILAPFAEETAHLNPLDGVDPEAVDYVERIYGMVEALVIAGDDRNRVWAEWAKILIAGVMDYDIRRLDEEFVPEEEHDNAK